MSRTSIPNRIKSKKAGKVMDVLPSGQAILALEKRIAFDAAGAATAAKTLHAATMFGPDAAHHTGMATLFGPVNATGGDALSGALGRSGLFEAPSAAAQDKSVVFIESDVADIPALIKDIDPSARIVMLDGTKDGVDAIADYLATHAGVQNVSIFSHGSEGNLNLGTASLDAASMQGRYAADLATIKASLAPDANILVYGCDFAENADGNTAAHLLASLTGANVAASTNLTGGTAEGGDFVLEDRIGTVSAPDILSPTIATDFDGVLAAPTTIFATSGTGQYHANLEFLTYANTSLATNGITNGATATYTTADGSTVTATFSAVSNAADEASFKPAAFSAYAPSKFYTGYNNTSSTSEQLYGGYNGTSSFTVTFTATDKNGNAYTPNIAFIDSEVTETSGEYYQVTTNGGAFQNVETVGATGYALTGVGTQTIMLSNDRAGVPVLVTTGATALNVTVEIANGKEGFALALVEPTLTLDANNSSGSTGDNYITTFTEKGSGVAIGDTDTQAVEPGVANAANAQIVLTNAQAGDLLSVGTLPSGITSSINTSVAGQITVNLAGSASLASYDTAIQAISFANTSSNPSTADRTIDVTFNDGNQNSNTAVATVHVVAVNDAPVESVPSAQATNKDTALSISGLSVSDVDANGGTETTTLSVGDGTISLASTSGLTFSKGTGTNDVSETFTGTLSAIDNAIATLTYQPTTGYVGSDTLTFATDDNGNTGTGGAKTTTQTLGITVNNVNPTDKSTIANQKFTDGQSDVSITTAQAFSDSLGLTLTYGATGLPSGLTLNASTGAITGTVDHDASKNAPSTTGSGATLDGTYAVVETASDGQGGSTTQSFTIESTNQAPVLGAATAAQTNSDGDTITAVNAAAAFSDPNGDPLTYAANGLPPGLTISSSGMITGTVAKNAAPGTDRVTVTATDDKGAAASEGFNWVIKDVPPTDGGALANQTVTDGQSGVSIATSQGFTDSNGNALTYTATGLPAGLAINATSGAITGTIDHDASKNAPATTGSGATLEGTYTVAVTASDGFGGAATQTFTIVPSNQAPMIGTSTANQASNDGATITPVNAAAAFSDPNGDPLTYAASGLPAGLTISSAGAIAGTIAANAQPSTDAVTVTAMDDKGAATTETFNWVVKDVPPTANGTLANQSYSDGQAGVSTATSQGFADSLNNALTYTASGLPAGLAISASTGKITGTVRHDDSKNAPVTSGSGATLDGTYTVIVTASDGLGGTATQTFTIDATNQAPVVGTVTANQANNDGDAIAPLTVATAFTDPNGDPLTYAASGLPAGLTISSAGVITGTVAGNAQPGTDAVIVTATDDKGAVTTETFSWAIKDVPPANNGTLANQTVTDGQAGVSIATSQGFSDSNGNVLTYAATGLPAGLTINASTGAITGTIDHDASKNAPVTSGSGATLDGTYTVTVTASDGLGGSTAQTFAIASTNQAPVVATKTAEQSAVDGSTITPVDASKAFADPNGDTLTYAASALPPGLSISSAGLITGTVAGNEPTGTYPVTVTATDDKGAATSETFNWVVNEVPPMASGTLANQAYTDSQAGIAIATARGFTDGDGNALTYGATGLPAGLAINSTTGQITGTIDHDASKNAPVTSGSGATLDGTYTVTVTATDGFGGMATQGFTIDSTNQAPVVGTSTANQTSKDGQVIAPLATAGGFTDPNTGDVLTYSASNLPSGLTIAATSGVINGTVAANAAPGTYAVRVLATDDKGAASREAFTWTIQDVPPTTSGTIANQTFDDSAGGISIATAGAFTSPNGLALTYRATGLPAGLSIDTGTGIITGQLDHDASKNAPVTSGSGAMQDGTYTIVVTTSDGQGGSAQKTFTIDATDNAPVVGTATADQHSSDGAKASVDASAAFADPNTGDVLTYSASGLPAGLGINASTGLISGTIDKAASLNGPYAVTVTASDDKGAATSETFRWSVADVPPTATPPLPDQAAYDGASLGTPTANGFTNPNGLPLTYSATGLPSGLAIDPVTGLISGTLNHDASVLATGGVYTIAVTANDGQGGSATNTFHLTATNQAPVVGTPTTNQTSLDGQAITQVAAGAAFSDPNGDPLTYAASGLPSGLSLDPASGRITGTVAPNATPGITTVTVTATDDKGAAARETFTWTVDDVAPTSAAALLNQGYADATAGISIATVGAFASPNGLPLIYSATGLPAGLNIDATTGNITGQLDHDTSKNAPVMSGSGATLEGTYTVAVTASDGQGGTDTQTFTIEATNTAPVLIKPTADQHGAAGATTSVAASAAFTDLNTGDVLTFSASGLPTGLGINAVTGLISGTIDRSASLNGPYAVTVTATDDKGAATSETFHWQVDNVAPVATPPLADQAVDDGSTISLATANGFTNPNDLPLTFSATGLPSGLAIDPTTGMISGTLHHDASLMAADGSYTVAVTVNDGQRGTATNTFHITASNEAPTLGAPTAGQTSSDGQSIAPVDASQAFADPNGDPLTYAVSGLPTGLSIDPSTGRITGMVAANAQPGVYAVTVLATDDKGAATPETFTWSIDDTPPMANGTIANMDASDGQAGIAIATASAFTNPDGLPLTYTATGLPSGLAINSQSGRITGTLDHDASAHAPIETGMGATLDGTYTITVTATDRQGATATQTFTFEATNSAPVIGNAAANQTGTDGNTASLNAALAFSDPNAGDILTYIASGLPAGLAIDPKSGMISGTIATNDDTAMPYAVTVTAIDDKGAATSEQFDWTINPLPSNGAAPIPNLATTDGSAVSIGTSSHFSNPEGAPLAFTASGLPSGLTIDAVSGVISGTLDHDASEHGTTTSGSGATLDGTYTVLVTATGDGAPATQTFTIDAANQAPVVITRTADQSATTGQTIAALDASQAFSDPNGDRLTYSAAGLPGGLTIDGARGKITGTVATTAPGSYAVTVTATDDKGAATKETFTYAVADAAPLAAGTIAGRTDADSTAGISVATAGVFTSPNDMPLIFAASGLPQGLTIDAATGVISGTLDHDASAHAPKETGTGAILNGTYTVVVTASDGQGGIASRTFTIDATNSAPVVGTATPDQHSFDGNAASLDASAAFSDPNTGDGLTYAATGLPSGLTINAATGLISGTIDKAASARGPYSVTVTATDDKGAATSETFAWTVEDIVPVATPPLPDRSSTDGSMVALTTANGFTNPNDLPLTYMASGLPNGLTINPNTGVISGKLDSAASSGIANGVYTLAITGSDGEGGSATNTFHLTVTDQPAAVVANTADQLSSDGQTISAVDASKAFANPNGIPLTYAASDLPAGLAIDPSTGLITGTVAGSATPGSYQVTVTAVDVNGGATAETFAWLVNDIAPSKNGTIAGVTFPDSSGAISIPTGSAFIVQGGDTLTYGATGLPAGLAIGPSTGLITGQLDHDASKDAPVTSGSGATLDGTYSVVVSASNREGGTATQTFTIDATNTAPALVNPTADQQGSAGVATSLDAAPAFADANTGDVLTYAATGLPTGLTINAATGLISGTIDKGAYLNGPYAVAVTATDDKGAATRESFTWSVEDIAPVATPPLADQAAHDGATLSLTTANGFTNPNGVPLTYAATGLPSGLGIDAATGVISGTLDHDASILTATGVYTIAVTASDGQGGSATNIFHLTATNQAPVVGAPTVAQIADDGEVVTPVDTSRAFTDPNGDPLTYAAANLPAGLAIDPRTGLITGAVASTVTSGNMIVTVTATDDKGAATLETFTWSIDDVPPVSVGTLAAQRFADSANDVSIAAANGFASPTGLPLTFRATGLPKGLTIAPSTGLITGFINHDASKNAPVTTGSGATLDGTYTVTVTADDGQGGLARQVLTIDSTNQAPALGERTADQSSLDGASVSVAAGTAFADPNIGDVLTFTATSLPKGLSINAATGAITGTIDRSASVSGHHTVALTATDDKGAATSETFTWNVADAPPTTAKAIGPVILDDGSAAFIATTPGFVSPNGLPLAFGASGLPAGLSIDPATGVISGTLDHDASKNAQVATGSGATLDGTYTVTVTASDNQGGIASQTFTIDARNEAPVIGVRTLDQSSLDGAIVDVAAGKAFTDRNAGDLLTFTASGLPKGLTIDAATGVITGIVDPSASGTTPYTVVVTATDDKGAATSQTLAWNVADAFPTAGPPIMLAAVPDGTTIAPFDTAGDFTSPNGLPLSYTVTGLPAGLAIDPTTGVITGTIDHDASANAPVVSGNGAAQGGTYTVVVTASDGQGGSASQTLILGTSNQAPVVTTQIAEQRTADGAIVSLGAGLAFVDPNGDPLTFAATGLPKGLAIDPVTGTITGTIDPSASLASPYSVTITATDDKGAATSETFAVAVADIYPVAISPATPITLGIVPDGTVILPFDTAPAVANPDGLPLTYAAAGLPAGLIIDPATGVITGTLDHDASATAPAVSGAGATQDGLYTVVVIASDGQGGSASQAFVLETSNQAPVVGTRTPDQQSTDGDVVSVNAAQAFSDPNGDSLTFAATGLPRGLAIDRASGAITGTIDPRASVYGPFAVTVTATDDKGASGSETFVWRVADAAITVGAPVPSVALPDGLPVVPINAAAHFSDAAGLSLTYSATGLPAGLSIDPATGAITGTLDHEASLNAPVTSGSGVTLEGTYQVTVSASDGQGGSATQTFAIVADNRAPVEIGTIAGQTGQAGQAIAPLAVAPDFVDPNSDPLVFSATGLPPGLTLDPTSGVVSGTIASTVAVPTTYPVTIVATDDKGASTSESFVYRVAPTPMITQPPVLPLASLATADAFIPLATALGDTIRNDAVVADTFLPTTREPEVAAANPVLDVINLTSGDQEQSVVIRTDDIVISTVNNIRPLDALQELATPGAGIVRSGAATNERGDRFDRANAAFGSDLEPIDSPTDTLGASLVDSSVSTIGDGTAINVETMLRDRVLTVTLDNRSAIACVVPVAHYAVTRADGSPLPNWLRVEGKGVVIGKVPGGVETIDLRITSTLRDGIVHERTVTIRTDSGAIRQQPAQAPIHRAGRSLSDMVAAVRQTPVGGGRGLSRFLD